ncbi:MAG: metallophosphatase domain-containing protein [Myxococcales bacterium]|nr:metallophosphatase domain-containing protein [Myxococcales bacterium]
MKLVFLSDTHRRHPRIDIPPRADLLVHAGDVSRRGTEAEVLAFLDWYASHDAPKVLIAGNHDRYAERHPLEMRRACEARGITYLLDEPTALAGLRVYGSPWVPRFRDMAFNLDRGAAIAARWALIPSSLDLLVTHGPPHGILDRTFFGLSVGCEALREALRARPPRLHVFGHIHEARGAFRDERTGCEHVNVANAAFFGRVHEAVVLER